MCLWKKIDKREKNSVGYDVLRYSLDLYEKAGGGDFSFTSILGDPLTDQKLLEKIKFIKSYPSIKAINVYTNLIALDNFNIRDIVKSGITNMAISTTIGNSEMYKRLYGVDLYHRMINNIITLLRVNDELNCPMRIKLLLRIDYDFLPYLNEVGEFKEITQYLDWNNIRVLGKTEWDDYNGVVKISDLPKEAKFKPNIRDKKIPCYGLFRKIQILKNGDISVCSCRISSELVVDNIFNYTSLYDYWKGEKLNSFRKKWIMGDIPSICRGCTHYAPYTELIENRIMRDMYLRLKNLKMRFF